MAIMVFFNHDCHFLFNRKRQFEEAPFHSGHYFKQDTSSLILVVSFFAAYLLYLV